MARRSRPHHRLRVNQAWGNHSGTHRRQMVPHREKPCRIRGSAQRVPPRCNAHDMERRLGGITTERHPSSSASPDEQLGHMTAEGPGPVSRAYERRDPHDPLGPEATVPAAASSALRTSRSGSASRGQGRVHPPQGLAEPDPSGNEDRLKASSRSTRTASALNTGIPFAVVDVDTQNGGDVEKVRALLAKLKVRIFAEVDTPGGGKHFYIAGHPDLLDHALHGGQPEAARLPRRRHPVARVPTCSCPAPAGPSTAAAATRSSSTNSTR